MMLILYEGDSAESALNRVLRDLPLLISTYILLLYGKKSKHIQASWAIAHLRIQIDTAYCTGTVAATR